MFLTLFTNPFEFEKCVFGNLRGDGVSRFFTMCSSQLYFACVNFGYKWNIHNISSTLYYLSYAFKIVVLF